MTFKELLNTVRFDDVAPHIVRMYPDMENSLGWFKIHFDMLRHMVPVFHENSNSNVCNITMKDWNDGTGLHLDAYPMEGDIWEHSLTKELIVSPDISATNEEIAACCLWHTSFYGFIEKHFDEVSEAFYRLDDCPNKSMFIQNKEIIKRYGGTIPSILQLSESKKMNLIKKTKQIVGYTSRHINRHKRKKLFRKEFMEQYYERMANISRFIVSAIPVLENETNHLTTKQLCGLFRSEDFCSEELETFADTGESGASYLLKLVSRYKMIPDMNGIVVHLITGENSDVLTEDTRQLYNQLAKGKMFSDLIIENNPLLKEKMILRYAAYNSEDNLLMSI